MGQKRALPSVENTPVAYKQTKLSFGTSSEKKLVVQKPAKMEPFNPDNYYDHAIAPLKGTTWYNKLKKELEMPYMQSLFKQLGEEAKKNKTIYPPVDLIFNAFVLTPFNKVRVVILGQDPYHNVGQAHGLSFSVPRGIPQPPSLKNIFKELAKEYPNFKVPQHGNLTKWAEQGIFLLNATLTVEKNMANSHSKLGWQKFTDFVIKTISNELDGVVFLLWGNFAQKKEVLIDKKKHAIVKAAHPSPFSYTKFADSMCFTKVNDALRGFTREPIDWSQI